MDGVIGVKHSMAFTTIFAEWLGYAFTDIIAGSVIGILMRCILEAVRNVRPGKRNVQLTLQLLSVCFNKWLFVHCFPEMEVFYNIDGWSDIMYYIASIAKFERRDIVYLEVLLDSIVVCCIAGPYDSAPFACPWYVRPYCYVYARPLEVTGIVWSLLLATKLIRENLLDFNVVRPFLVGVD